MANDSCNFFNVIWAEYTLKPSMKYTYYRASIYYRPNIEVFQKSRVSILQKQLTHSLQCSEFTELTLTIH